MKFKLLPVILLLPALSFAQESGTQYYIDKLKDNSNNQVFNRTAVHDSIGKLDTVNLIKVIDKLEQAVKGSSAKIKTRVAALKARLFFYKLIPGDSLYATQMKAALFKAHELEEPFMIAEYSRWYSEMLYTLKKRTDAVQYAFNSIVLQEQLGLQYFPSVNTFYFTVGEMFIRTRNSEEAIKWLNKGLSYSAGSVIPADHANALNNLGLAYIAAKDYKKSLEAYEQSMSYSRQHGLEDWYQTSSNNRIHPLLELGKYDECKILLEEGYDQLKGTNNYYALAGICYFFGRVANLQKDFTTALHWLKQAEEFADKTGVRAYRIKISKEISVCYDGLKQFDRSLVYYKEYKDLEDSSAKVEASVRSDYLLAKANFEKEQLYLKKLRVKRESEIKVRNTGLVTLILFAGIIIWRLNSRRKKARQSMLDMEKYLQMLSDNHEKAAKVEEMSKKMILTEEDWQRFQTLFNSTYPGFLQHLKEKFQGITEAEIRMACLIKMRLNTKQIAAMQGISPDSVHKTRQRLRQRFATATTAELETLILAT